MSEWCRYDFDLLDHQRIAGANLSRFPKQWREPMREAMASVYWRAIVILQKQRSDDGLISEHALWGPGEARREICEELVLVGMLEPRAGGFYYPRNYLEKNRSGAKIRSAVGGAAKRKADQRERARLAALAAASPPAPVTDLQPPNSHTEVTRDLRVTPVCVSVCVSEDRKGEPESLAETPAAVAELVRLSLAGASPPPVAPPAPAPRASGAAGFAAVGWVEGVRSVTDGRPTLAPWETRAIEDLALERPPDADPAAWAFIEGATFARRQRASKPPMRVDAKNYLAWVGDGRQGPLDRSVTTIARVTADTPPAPYHRPFVKRTEAPAVPPPADFCAALDALGEP